MLIPNCLFRLGAAAILLSNRPRDASVARYKLLHVIRTHIGAIDNAYGCLYQQEDSEGHLGIALSKEVMPLSGIALRNNLFVLGPLVLPYGEILRYLWSALTNEKNRYIPDFGKAFDHICVHAGGRAVIDEVQKNLRLTEEQVEASRMTLYRFGNTSSSSVWYELGYVEAKGWMKKGMRTWQLGLGSGFKCNSAVWKCLRDVERPKEGAWAECIDRFPVQIPEIMKFE